MLDKKLKTKNIPTQQARNFINQEFVQLSLPDTPPPVTNIFAGYIWNELQTDYAGIYIVCPNGNKNEWEIEISTRTENISTPVVPIHNATPRKKRVVPRKVEKDAKNKGE